MEHLHGPCHRVNLVAAAPGLGYMARVRWRPGSPGGKGREGVPSGPADDLPGANVTAAASAVDLVPEQLPILVDDVQVAVPSADEHVGRCPLGVTDHPSRAGLGRAGEWVALHERDPLTG